MVMPYDNFPASKADVLNAAGGTFASGLNSGERHIGEIGGNITGVADEFQRANNSSAYSAGFMVTNHTGTGRWLVFSGMGRVTGGHGYIPGALLETNDPLCSAQLRLHLYNSAPAASALDNAAYSPLWAHRAQYIGSIDFSALGTMNTAVAGVMARSEAAGPVKGFRCAPTDTNLYGFLQAINVFTASASAAIRVQLWADRN